MIYKPKNRRYYRVKFKCKGQLVHRSMGAKDAKTARAIEGKIRAELARGNWGIFESKVAPKLGDFLRRDFLPFIETKCADKVSTLAYYQAGAKRFLESDLAT